MKKIYNKKTRERLLQEKAYMNVYREADTDVADQRKFAKIDPLEDEKARLQGFNSRENEEMEFDERGFAKNTEAGREGEGSGFKIGDWVWDDEGMHASIVNIDGDEIDLYDGKEGWTVRQSDISHEQRDHDDGKYSREPSNYPGQPGAQY